MWDEKVGNILAGNSLKTKQLREMLFLYLRKRQQRPRLLAFYPFQVGSFIFKSENELFIVEK